MKHTVTHQFTYRRALPRRTALAGALALMMPALAAHGQAVLRPDAGAAAQPGITAVGGTPVVNITAPNAAGLSHNRFTDYNVGANGLILNNSATSVHTQLAGTIAGNAQLGGAPARIILNEVTGGQVSRLNGATEIAGQAARLIVANPNGLVADGAGFINATRATLVAGKPVFDQDGGIASFETRGRLVVEGKGLDAADTDVDLVARSLRINADARAKKLVGVALDGNVKVDGDTIAYRRNASGTDTPEIAIDVARLGSMHANAITLVGAAKGVGVNVDGKIDVVAGLPALDASGKVFTQTQSGANIGSNVSGVSVTQIQSGPNANSGGDGVTIVQHQSGANVAPGSHDVTVVQQQSGANAEIGGSGGSHGQTMTFDNTVGTAKNGGMTIVGGLSNGGELTADTVSVHGGATVASGASLAARRDLSVYGGLSKNDGVVRGQSVSVHGGAQIGSDGQLIASDALSTYGDVKSEGKIRAGSAAIYDGLDVAKGGSVAISGSATTYGTVNNDGTFHADAVTAYGNVTNSGKIRTEKSITVYRGLSNSASGRVSAGGALAVYGGLSNHGQIERYAKVDTLVDSTPVAAPPVVIAPTQPAAPAVKPAEPVAIAELAQSKPESSVVAPVVDKPVEQATTQQVADKPVEQAATQQQVANKPVEQAATQQVADKPVEQATTQQVANKPVEQAATQQVADKPVEQATTQQVADKPVEQAATQQVANKPVEQEATQQAANKPFRPIQPVQQVAPPPFYFVPVHQIMASVYASMPWMYNPMMFFASVFGWGRV
ncbi:filamentous hemagglutinin N-terminal domain-containing protein [Burkholderia sp. AU19243]|uniref:filamentous hemagglutinin N-terminal domain-containing protein n=1 Tax=Burkholderia sp. AU19243 TaxID=2824810 RepID=UPI001B933E5D|nr:filamentous hemagglutinin N-terminal domain-containing protein [Burkholderia sp. AU19243]MBR8144286.1 filamentous hemagglutinin N-terminal domain-containing protein [Burkholderia vietnamiensis]MBR8366122.1 filamentous hemagglutinin N-terminal domain-containing protein [Burkholderia sp. AU19243]